MPANPRHARLELGHFGIKDGEDRIEGRRGDWPQAWTSACGGSKAPCQRDIVQHIGAPGCAPGCFHQQAKTCGARKQLARARDGEIEEGQASVRQDKAVSAQYGQGPQPCRDDARH